eukprot:CAMPEP_0114254838 /NCGR_PEP_ID=MMETSP0058-20121206/17221_1 /TAXON_ID=36894 /ORGANISM="Pyramimonas parkeae, CCMP726" /LENGTH=80 /DNA_ID=CAMNT_0001369141 /DNA_START=213 /DNA_END=455 /DNA_ORIENTATION=-
MGLPSFAHNAPEYVREWIEQFNVDFYALHKDHEALQVRVKGLEIKLARSDALLQLVLLIGLPWLGVVSWQLWKLLKDIVY